MNDALSADAGQGAAAFSQQLLAAKHLVFELDFGGCHAFGCGAERQQVVLTRRPQVTALYFHDDHEHAAGFDCAVVVAVCTEKFRAAHLEIRKIVGVMQHAHGIGFLITHADLECVLTQHSN